MKKAIIIVLDSLGIGQLPDAHLYGDDNCNTLKNISDHVRGLNLPNLEKMGLGNLTEVTGVVPQINTLGSYGKLAELSKGKDTTAGHWELMGIITEEAMPTFPNGFPDELISEFKQLIGRDIIGNEVASGTEIIERLGKEHMETGFPIIYTSADSVFQIAAHEDIIPIEELYNMCKSARKLLDGKFKVGRVIARPFRGLPGNFVRTANRHDYSLKPPKKTLLDTLIENNKEVISVGKIYDIFAGEGISKSYPTKNNMEGVDKTISAYENLQEGLVFTNLVDFDSLYGHRNDAVGYAKALEGFDKRLPELWEILDENTILILVADHGNDPTTPGTDHNREYVPLLIMGNSVQKNLNIGTRSSFGDLGATLAEYFNVKYEGYGTSMWNEIKKN
ncbi:phosphopentomutase [Desulfonispora thiosulfatigenes DSM 11270]|uniref:Phosphopentomutase n=1 Tax=Desulfonispora thiosulfatigenes DSM 11270 TaxID=656914 RepID=A0A1W1VPE3_DESTI|nr:phosphopentomutase [Desulfonispora thiosulfatigenes]SMB95229.1 phosphopentomutase [Desulfonispora thiosulfatigenes DSM 11270]